MIGFNARLYWTRSNAKPRPINYQQFCLSEVQQPLAKFVTCYKLSQIVDDVKFWLLCVRRKRTISYEVLRHTW